MSLERTLGSAWTTCPALSTSRSGILKHFFQSNIKQDLKTGDQAKLSSSGRSSSGLSISVWLRWSWVERRNFLQKRRTRWGRKKQRWERKRERWEKRRDKESLKQPLWAFTTEEEITFNTKKRSNIKCYPLSHYWIGITLLIYIVNLFFSHERPCVNAYPN